MNTRSVAYLRHVVRSKFRSALFVSYPSSGWNWAVDVLSFALGKHFLGHYELSYREVAGLKTAEIKPFQLNCPADARAQHVPSLTSVLPGIKTDYCYHTHGYWGESPLFRLSEAKTVIITRDYPTALFSGYAKRRKQYENFEQYLHQSGSLERMVTFYNSWGAFHRGNTQRTLTVRYEDMRNAPTQTFSNMIKFVFEENIPDQIVNEAIEYFSFDRQKEREYKFAQDETMHFHYKGKTSYRQEIGEELYGRLQDELDRRIHCVLYSPSSKRG